MASAKPTLVDTNKSKVSLPSNDNKKMWYYMAVPAFVVSLHAFSFLTSPTPPIAADPNIFARLRSSVFAKAHISGGFLAILLGPMQLQFDRHLRVIGPRSDKDRPRHRWLGRLYYFGILVGSIYGFQIAFEALIYPIGQWGFAGLAMAWLFTAVMGAWHIAMAPKRDVAKHRRWMTRNFSLTYAAVMLRWQLPLFISLGMEPKAAESLAGYICWVPHLVLTEWWVQKERSVFDTRALNK